VYDDLRAKAASQGGILLARDVTDRGYRWEVVRTLLRDEGWTKPFRSVYVEPGRPDDVVTRVRAIQLLRPRLVASHELAGLLHALPVRPPVPFEFTSDDGLLHRPPTGRVYRWQLPSSDVCRINGIRVTTASRTVVDIARSRDRDRAVMCLDHVLRSGSVALDDLAA
jgi:hypothetical protein